MVYIDVKMNLQLWIWICNLNFQKDNSQLSLIESSKDIQS